MVSVADRRGKITKSVSSGAFIFNSAVTATLNIRFLNYQMYQNS